MMPGSLDFCLICECPRLGSACGATRVSRAIKNMTLHSKCHLKQKATVEITSHVNLLVTQALVLTSPPPLLHIMRALVLASPPPHCYALRELVCSLVEIRSQFKARSPPQHQHLLRVPWLGFRPTVPWTGRNFPARQNLQIRRALQGNFGQGG